MKPFSLDAVLKYRKQLEDKAATRLVDALRELHKTQLKLASTKDSYGSLSSRLAENQQKGIDIQELLRFQTRLEWVKAQIELLEEELISKKKNVSSIRSEVMQRSRDRKVMEQLRDRQNKEYRDYLEKKETLQLDEIAVLSHDRKKQDQEQ